MAQDAFPTYRNSILPGEHFSPSTDIFGTCAFSMGFDIGAPRSESDPGSPNVITGDSVVVLVHDLTGTGIKKIGFYYRVVAGPHAGKKVQSSSQVFSNGIAAEEIVYDPVLPAGTYRFSMEFDDTYFRGGDVVQYFWFVETGDGTVNSYPAGLTDDPELLSGIASAEQLTKGLLEVSFLPKINWDADYLARIAADPIGDLDPTPAELANSAQANCILYVNKVNTARRSGSENRTSFMYTLDGLGYKGNYDVYDVQGFGNTNNDLGSRASVDQSSRYSLIIHDVGRMAFASIPNGSDPFALKVDQAMWYRNYLDNGLSSLAGSASLWVIGENWAFENATNSLVSTYMAVSSPSDDQSIATNPDVAGQASFTFVGGATGSFAVDRFSLKGGCPLTRTFDGFGSSGSNSVVAHKYKIGTTLGQGAVVLNKSPGLKWNTIAMGFNWFDVTDTYCAPVTGDPPCPTPAAVRRILASKILNGVLPSSCIRSPNSTDVPPDDYADVAPTVTTLFQNIPNPFNPTTAIKFDLAAPAHVRLRVFDVSGKIVRTLVDGQMANKHYSILWNGANDAGQRVASGIYVYRLDTGAFSATRKLVLLK